jgi:DNA-binding response OmpR family regulator
MDNFNILIIEDETLIALRIKQSLQKHGYNVVCMVQDAQSAIECISYNHIDLMLVDITIKGYFDGIETAKLIQKSFDIGVIFITSHQEDKFLEEASQVNFLGYIVKPFMEERLIREVKLAKLRLTNPNETSMLDLKPYIYDMKKQILKKDNEEIVLSKNEKCFLHMLITNKNAVVYNEQIDCFIWNDNPVDDVSRRHLLFRLRKKVPELDITTLKGIGYKLIV